MFIKGGWFAIKTIKAIEVFLAREMRKKYQAVRPQRFQLAGGMVVIDLNVLSN